jgi:N-acetylglucosaminyldiphosphoundecaprenol N-acetyl-beta-D-mannosaminyltransferase
MVGPGHAPPATAWRQTFDVFGTAIDAIEPHAAVERIAGWAYAGDSRCVCICNAHSMVTAQRDPAFRQALQQADLATPDGAPVAWMGRWQGWPGQARVSGPDLMLDYCAFAARRGEAIFLYGSTPDTLARLETALHLRWPTLRIAGSHSPPFRPLSADEDAAVVDRINRSGARTVWVSLGCPKQEAWMAAHRGRVQAVMVGVGAAFDFHAGVLPRAPRWMRDHGLEWLHRLASEPGRLWRRYLLTNSLFMAYAARQWWQVRRRRP